MSKSSRRPKQNYHVGIEFMAATGHHFWNSYRAMVSEDGRNV
ncbi:MAG: hypothetical protein WCA10_19515 [Terracidiphilus sp.]